MKDGLAIVQESQLVNLKSEIQEIHTKKYLRWLSQFLNCFDLLKNKKSM